MASSQQASPSERVLREYRSLAANYDRRWSRYIQDSTEATLKRVTLPDCGAVLDVGCGTGSLLLRLHQMRQFNLVGIDPVNEMLRKAQTKLGASAAFVQAWAEEIPFADQTFDLVFSCNMLHYLPHPDRALAEMHRVLGPCGRVVITDWCADYSFSKFRDLYLKLARPAHHRTYSERECLQMLERSGFSACSSERYKISRWWGLMTVQGVKPPATLPPSDK